jgi:lipoprotein-anchoring transpeptidase ErfK/SrfK
VVTTQQLANGTNRSATGCLITDNQYGTYGFHDAPWRKPSEFGNIDPNSMNGSHGCVQLPTEMAKWVYDWAEIGTTVVVKS